MDYYLLLGLKKDVVKISKIENVNGLIKVEVKGVKKKVRCPICSKFTSSVHDKLKPITSKYPSCCENPIDLIIYKRRFHCYECNKNFIEEMYLNTAGGSIANNTKIKIRKELLEYNLSIKSIAINNRVSETVVRKELDLATSVLPDYQKNLPSVISFDEFKADTNKGKYAFVLNNPIHHKTLDILPSRKKEYLIQ